MRRLIQEDPQSAEFVRVQKIREFWRLQRDNIQRAVLEIQRSYLREELEPGVSNWISFTKETCFTCNKNVVISFPELLSHLVDLSRYVARRYDEVDKYFIETRRDQLLLDSMKRGHKRGLPSVSQIVEGSIEAKAQRSAQLILAAGESTICDDTTQGIQNPIEDIPSIKIKGN